MDQALLLIQEAAAQTWELGALQGAQVDVMLTKVDTGPRAQPLRGLDGPPLVGWQTSG